jgi:deoxyribodipyrimidine photo-lyase
MSTNLRRTIVWFRNDLRLHDNPVLTAAAQQLSRVGGEHLCLYCFDPRHFSRSQFGSVKTGVYRAKFLLESVQSLKKNLRSIGSDLIIKVGRPEEVIPSFMTPGSEVFVHGEVTKEETDVELAVETQARDRGCSISRIYGGNTLYHLEDLPFRRDFQDMQDTFTPFKERVEKRCRVRDLLPTVTRSSLHSPCTESIDSLSREYLGPSLKDLGFADEEISQATELLDPRGVMGFTGGEDSALARIQSWAFEGDHLKEYFDIRNGMLGESYSSKLSPALAHGCVSARKIFHEVRRYESERRLSNKSTYWLIFELIWRDFFRAICSKYGTRVFFSGGAVGKQISWSKDEELIRRWKEGRTGWPLVDANMRELAATGWMSNRGRQNVASFLVLDYGVDWRVGADHFESLLLDHDVCSNYGNWNAAAGLLGGRVNKFNITKQSRDYDSNGDYIRHWLPELRAIPAPHIFEPWKLSRADQLKYGVSIGNGPEYTYPSPSTSQSASGDIALPSAARSDTVDHVSVHEGKKGSKSGQEHRHSRAWTSVPKRGRVQHF